MHADATLRTEPQDPLSIDRHPFSQFPVCHLKSTNAHGLFTCCCCCIFFEPVLSQPLMKGSLPTHTRARLKPVEMQLQPLLQGFVIKTLLLGAISARLKEQPTQASKTQHADQLVIGAYQSFSDFRQVVQNKFNSFLHRQEDVISDEHQNSHRDAPTLISTGSTDSIVKRYAIFLSPKGLV